MANKRIIIIGGGGHAKVVIDAISSSGLYRIEGICDPRLRAGSKVAGIPVLGGDEYLDAAKGGSLYLALGLGTIRASRKRKGLYERYCGRFKFPAIIHKNALVAKSAAYGNGVQIMAGTIVQPDAAIGENVIINTGSIIEHDCRIAPHSHISIGAILGGGVEVGERSHVGMGARILQGVKVGKHATVGAGAVVTKDVPDGATVCGVPARVVRK
jgi:UDP-perosamine 4-acetyltransferase